VNLSELFNTWQVWNAHAVAEQAARRAETDGRDEDAAELRRGLAQDPTAPTAIDALAAQHELVELLGGWRWHTITAAREQGATWDDVAAVTGTDPITAQQGFREHLAHAEHAAEQSGITFHDAERYRAAAHDDTDDLPERDAPRAQTGEETHAMTDDRDDHRIEHISGPDRVEDGLVAGEIALPGGLPSEDDDGDDVPLWGAAFDVADRDGYVMFDPAAPGGVRGLTPDERTELLDAVRAGQPASRVADRSTQDVELHDGHDQVRGFPPTEAEAGRPRHEQTAAGDADPTTAVDDSHPDDSDRLGQRLDHLRVQLSGYTWREGVDRDQALADRREQLGRWHDDDAGADLSKSSDDAPADDVGHAGRPQCLIDPDDPRWDQ
jgi:hypothetical protein